MTKFRMIGLLVVLAVLGYSALWFSVAFETERRVTQRLQQWQLSGNRVTHGAVEVAGFPYRIAVTIDGLAVAARDQGFGMRAAHIQMLSHLWTPGHWILFASGAEAALAGGQFLISSPTVQMSHRLKGPSDSGLADIRLQPTEGSAVTLDQAPGLESPVVLDDFFAALRLYPAPSAGSASGLYGDSVADIRLRAQHQEARISITGLLTGEGLGWSEKALAAWRDGGGFLNLTALELVSGDSRFKGEGGVSLDEALRPLGSFSGILSGRLGNLLPLAGLAPAAASSGLGTADQLVGDGSQVDLMAQGGVLMLGARAVVDLPAIRP